MGLYLVHKHSTYDGLDNIKSLKADFTVEGRSKERQYKKCVVHWSSGVWSVSVTMASISRSCAMCQAPFSEPYVDCHLIFT